MCKYKLVSKEHEELKLKLESINDTNDSLEMKQTISCAIPISRVDASTSCIDLIDDSCSNPCNEKCYGAGSKTGLHVPPTAKKVR